MLKYTDKNTSCRTVHKINSYPLIIKNSSWKEKERKTRITVLFLLGKIGKRKCERHGWRRNKRHWPYWYGKGRSGDVLPFPFPKWAVRLFYFNSIPILRLKKRKCPQPIKFSFKIIIIKKKRKRKDSVRIFLNKHVIVFI